MVMARPFGNYFNDTTFKGILLAEFVYMIAVSYTHLDVYKRQGLYESCEPGRQKKDSIVKKLKWQVNRHVKGRVRKMAITVI